MRKKIITFLAVLYVLSPIDFLPDVIPILGWIDDVLAIVIAVKEVLKKEPPQNSGGWTIKF